MRDFHYIVISANDLLHSHLTGHSEVIWRMAYHIHIFLLDATLSSIACHEDAKLSSKICAKRIPGV